MLKLIGLLYRRKTKDTVIGVRNVSFSEHDLSLYRFDE